MGKFSRRQIDDFFLIFPENRIWHFMQILAHLGFTGRKKIHEKGA